MSWTISRHTNAPSSVGSEEMGAEVSKPELNAMAVGFACDSHAEEVTAIVYK